MNVDITATATDCHPWTSVSNSTFGTLTSEISLGNIVGNYPEFRKLFKGLNPLPLFTNVALELRLTADLELLRISFLNLAKLELDELSDAIQLAPLVLCKSLRSLSIRNHHKVPPPDLAAAVSGINSLTHFRSAPYRHLVGCSKSESLLAPSLSVSRSGLVVDSHLI